MVKLVVVDWDDLFWDVYELASKVRKSGYKPDMIVAIARGGWVIGRLLSDFLSVNEAAGLTIRFYKDIGETAEKPQIVQPLRSRLDGKRVLVVDDIVDSGETMKLAVRHVKERGAEEVRAAAPYLKPWSIYKPDYYVKVVDGWVVFPYEYVETMKALEDKIKSLEELKRMGLRGDVIDKLGTYVKKD